MVREIRGFWVGARRFRGEPDLPTLVTQAGGWAAFIEGGPTLWTSLGINADAAAAWANTRGERTRGEPITLDNPRYPTILREVPGPPPVLCVEGSVDILRRPMVAVVGTRGCTAYGASIARYLASALTRAGLVVVSGLARGVDAHAHGAAGGDTVAVLAHGLAHQAPPSNAGLRARMVAAGGAVVTTHADDDEPRPYTFPARNRWIAALARAVIVVEAPASSGALLTAMAALELGREVYAVPGQLGVPSQRGNLDLLRDGARVVWDVDEVVAELSGVDRPETPPWQLALFGGATVDAAAELAGRPTAALLAELGRMEVAGTIRRLPGHRYAPQRPAGEWCDPRSTVMPTPWKKC
jgi:DNA processing protein